MFETKNVIFMIEGGRALEMVKHHIAEVKRVAEQSRALALELGVERIFTSLENGTLLSVEFPGKVHRDFTKPSKHGSHPKKGTEWAKRFDAQQGYECPSYVISDALGIPLSISYSLSNGGHGSHMIGYPFSECGFLYLSADGPYAMWVPDVPAIVASNEAKGYTVEEPAKSFKLEFDGCRRIEKEEWDFLVAQHNLEKKRKARAIVRAAAELAKERS